MNILILSAGTRNKVVQAFKEALAGKGRVVATDCSSVAPALYDADKAYVVPEITAAGYLDRILEICREEEIDGALSLIDPELSLIAKERARFEQIGVTVVVSSYELCEASLDKYDMYEMLLKLGIPTAMSFLKIDLFRKAMEENRLHYPVFVKPRKGSASLNINKVSSDEELNTLFHVYDDLMIQEYMDGQEYGADAYVDMISGKCTQIFLKKKIKMRAGETDKSVSVKNDDAFRLIAQMAESAGYRGMIDLDLFEKNGTWYLSEVNPRFGGGYPHAHASGVNLVESVLRNLKGETNPVSIGEYKDGIYMMKYNEICILKEADLIHANRTVE